MSTRPPPIPPAMPGETTTPPWDQLPIVVLEEIFKNLTGTHLAWVRLVCKAWNEAIYDSPALMWKFEPFFGQLFSLSATFPLIDSEVEASAVKARFRRATINSGMVNYMAGSRLWARVGETIRSLRVLSGNSKLSVARLAEILEVLPSLTHLSVSVTQSEVVFDAEPLFELRELRELEMYGSDPRFVDLFRLPECKNLHSIKFDGLYPTSPHRLEFEPLVPVIHAHQGSLQEIEIDHVLVNDEKLQQVFAAEELRDKLKRLRVRWLVDFRESRRTLIQIDGVVELCNHFPMIESLALRTNFIDSEVLEVLRQNLKHLRDLSISIYLDFESEDLKKFLNRMPQLEILDVEFSMTREESTDDYFYLDLRGVSCPNLKKLRFSRLVFASTRMAEFLGNSPHLRHLGLQCFRMADTADILDALAPLNLEHLEYYCGIPSDPDKHCNVAVPGLRTLRTDIVCIARCFPDLEEIYLVDRPVDDDHIRALMETLPKLAVIDAHCDTEHMTDAALECLADQGRRLRSLRLRLNGDRTTRAARNRLPEELKYTTRVDLIVTAGDKDEWGNSNTEKFWRELEGTFRDIQDRCVRLGVHDRVHEPVQEAAE